MLSIFRVGWIDDGSSMLLKNVVSTFKTTWHQNPKDYNLQLKK
jgi:hypothetical protein